MELIRCDNCQREVRPEIRHLSVKVEGSLLTITDFRAVKHFCSESCIGAYFFGSTPRPIPAVSE